MTERERLYNAYIDSHKYDLNDCYERCSEAKKKAFENCRKMCYEDDGYGLKIISHNGFMFTAGYLYKKDNDIWLCYITKTKTKRILVNQTR